MQGDQGPRGMDGAKGAQGRPVGTFCNFFVAQLRMNPYLFICCHSIYVFFFFFKFIVRSF